MHEFNPHSKSEVVSKASELDKAVMGDSIHPIHSARPLVGVQVPTSTVGDSFDSQPDPRRPVQSEAKGRDVQNK
jgi:hypothetical protein